MVPEVPERVPIKDATHALDGRNAQRTVRGTNHRIGRKIVGIANKQHAVIKLENLSVSTVHRIRG